MNTEKLPTDYPYLASWFDEDPEDSPAFNCVWIHWNGVFLGSPPKRVIIKGENQTLTYEEFKEKCWNKSKK